MTVKLRQTPLGVRGLQKGVQQNAMSKEPMTAAVLNTKAWNTYPLEDLLEMRSDLNLRERTRLMHQLRAQLEPGECIGVPAFMVGTQAVLCPPAFLPEACWIYDRKNERLSFWQMPRRSF